MIPLVDLVAQYHSIKEEIDEAVNTTLESGHFILGPAVTKFEESIASHLDMSYAIGLASGTDALVLALRALDIGAGHEVIVPAYTFFATAGTVMSVGAKPVFVDIDPVTYEIDVTQIKKQITTRTKAIIPVHLYGHPADMDPILGLAQANGLKIIEDNAQAFGATYRNKHTGSLGDIGCLSFFPTKNLGAFGDGGMVVTNDPALAERMRMLRTHGWRKKYYSEEVGYNSRLDALQAAILQVKFRYVDSWNEKRREIAHRYSEKLAPLGVTVPAECDWARHVYHLYVIRSRSRDELQAFLKQNGITSEVYYPLPPHLSLPCRKFGYKEDDYPHAERASEEALALPLYPELSVEQQDEVISVVKQFLS